MAEHKQNLGHVLQGYYLNKDGSLQETEYSLACRPDIRFNWDWGLVGRRWIKYNPPFTAAVIIVV